MTSPALRQILAWMVALLVPVALVLSLVRLMLTPLYINIEYNTPGFPDDPYGFTKQDRLHYAEIARQYLLNDAGIAFLGDLRFPDGQPVYNERELGHMVDVKVVVRAALRVWIASLVGLLLLGVWAWFGGWRESYRDGLQRGGWLTVFFLVFILLFVLFGFDMFFVLFHEVFFKAGTWTFLWSDTLIRLFPERFWQDIFLAVGVLSLAGGLGLALGLRPRRRSD